MLDAPLTFSSPVTYFSIISTVKQSAILAPSHRGTDRQDSSRTDENLSKSVRRRTDLCQMQQRALLDCGLLGLFVPQEQSTYVSLKVCSDIQRATTLFDGLLILPEVQVGDAEKPSRDVIVQGNKICSVTVEPI